MDRLLPSPNTHAPALVCILLGWGLILETVESQLESEGVEVRGKEHTHTRTHAHILANTHALLKRQKPRRPWSPLNRHTRNRRQRLAALFAWVGQCIFMQIGSGAVLAAHSLAPDSSHGSRASRTAPI